MHHLFHNILELLTCFVSFLVSVVMFYVGLTMIDMIGVNLNNTIHFSQVSTMYERVSAKISFIFFNTINKFFTFMLTCFTRNQPKIT